MPIPKFQFGGATGSTVTSIIFLEKIKLCQVPDLTYECFEIDFLGIAQDIFLKLISV